MLCVCYVVCCVILCVFVYCMMCCVVLCCVQEVVEVLFDKLRARKKPPKDSVSPLSVPFSATLKDFNRTHNHTSRKKIVAGTQEIRGMISFSSQFWFSDSTGKRLFVLIYIWLFRSQVGEWVQWVVEMGSICYPHPKTVNQPQISPSPWIPNRKVQKLRNTEILLPLKGHILLVTKSVFLNHL